MAEIRLWVDSLHGVVAGDRGDGTTMHRLASLRDGGALVAHAVQILADSGTAEIHALTLAGPGPFTGVKTGLSTLYGLRDALQLQGRRVQIHSIGTLACMWLASGLPEATVLADARRDRWFVQSFPAMEQPGDWMWDKVQAECGPPFVCMQGDKHTREKLADLPVHILQPEDLARAALALLQQPEQASMALRQPVPLYVRDADIDVRVDWRRKMLGWSG